MDVAIKHKGSQWNYSYSASAVGLVSAIILSIIILRYEETALFVDSFTSTNIHRYYYHQRHHMKRFTNKKPSFSTSCVQIATKDDEDYTTRTSTSSLVTNTTNQNDTSIMDEHPHVHNNSETDIYNMNYTETQKVDANDNDNDNAKANNMYFAKQFIDKDVRKNGKIEQEKETAMATVSSPSTTLPYAKELTELITSPQIELIDTGLVLLSSFLVAVGTLPSTTLPQPIFNLGIFLENNILSYIFGVGFFVRWYAVGLLKLDYLTKPLPLIDFFASVLPLALINYDMFLGILNHHAVTTTTTESIIASSSSSSSFLPQLLLSNSALVNLRLLRILRLQELLVDLETFEKVGNALGIQQGNVRPYQLQLTRVLISVFTLCSVATGLIYAAEHEVNPLIPDYFTALYFGLTTLTTVGFGDITPITPQGKLVVVGSILVGVAVIPAQAAELVEAILDFQQERRRKNMFRNTLRARQMYQGQKGEGGVEGDVMNDEYEIDSMIDPRIACASCGRRSHRNDALYCWSCGAKLWQ